MRRYVLVTAFALPFILGACNGSGCGGGGGGNQTTSGGGGGGSGSGPSVDSKWKTDIPNQFADSSSGESVPVVIQFASAFTSSDSTAIVASGGTITSTDYAGSTDLIGATYTVGSLVALARSYTGSRIIGLTAQVGGTSFSGGGSGNGPTGC